MIWPSAGLRGTKYDAMLGGTLYQTPVGTNTKGSWQELTSSLPRACDGFLLGIIGGGGSDQGDVLLDIGVGGAGSEQTILSNYQLSIDDNWNTGVRMMIPVPIKAGARVAIRAQSTRTQMDFFYTLHPFAGPFFSALKHGRATTYGANTGDSGGTPVDSGAVANVKGSYAQLTAAASRPISYAIVCVGNANNFSRATADGYLDISVGGSGSEVVILPDLQLRQSINNGYILPQYFAVPLHVKQGERIAVRTRWEITDATDRIIDITLIGFD